MSIRVEKISFSHNERSAWYLISRAAVTCGFGNELHTAVVLVGPHWISLALWEVDVLRLQVDKGAAVSCDQAKEVWAKEGHGESCRCTGAAPCRRPTVRIRREGKIRVVGLDLGVGQDRGQHLCFDEARV